jgi:hypothetical protein
MPPVGSDEHVQAIHVLNVLDCAKILVAEIAKAGGVDKLQLAQIGVRDALKALFEQASKLQVYESRAKVRGTVGSLNGERLAQAVKEVRDQRLLSADEEDVRDATPEQVAATFSLDDPEEATAPAADDDEPAPASGERKPADAFSL